MMSEEESMSEKLEDQNVIYVTEDYRPDWTKESVKELLKLYDEKIDMLDTGIVSTQKKIWELVSKEMLKKEYYFTPAQCENKWKTLKRTYRAKQEHLDKFGSSKKPCPFESEIAEILSRRPQESWSRSGNYPPSNKIMKIDSNNDDIFNINLNNPPGFSGDEESSQPSNSIAYVLQDSAPLVEELSQLRDSITKNHQYQIDILKKSTELQQKIVRHLDNAATRENNSLKLQQARIEQQNEIIKQMRTQNTLLQKLLDKIG